MASMPCWNNDNASVGGCAGGALGGAVGAAAGRTGGAPMDAGAATRVDSGRSFRSARRGRDAGRLAIETSVIKPGNLTKARPNTSRKRLLGAPTRDAVFLHRLAEHGLFYGCRRRNQLGRLFV